MQEHTTSLTSAAAVHGGGMSRVDEEDTLDGYVDVQVDIIAAEDDTTATTSLIMGAALRTVQGGGGQQVVVEEEFVTPPPVLVVNSSPIIVIDDDEIPIALPEESFPSPRRRVTPTSASRRRQSSSHRVTYEDLIRRPRSNPRSRTPMRYESPLEHGAFLSRAGDEAGEVPQQQDDFQPRVISIRPGAGLAVGVVRTMPERVSCHAFFVVLGLHASELHSLVSCLWWVNECIPHLIYFICSSGSL
jgi:hypothetical protein